MHIQNLPAYSAERYFLLSEIENKAQMVFLKDLNATGSVYLLGPHIGLLYLLWESTHKKEKLKQDILSACEMLAASQSTILVVVECLIEDRESFGAIKPDIEKIMLWFKESFTTNYLVFGISDKPEGTAGLEKCYEFVNSVVDYAPILNGKLKFFTLDRGVCLGFDPLREPDASSNLYQNLCYDSKEEYALWEVDFIDKALLSCDNDSDNNKSSRQGWTEPVYINLSISIFFAILIALIWYCWVNV